MLLALDASARIAILNSSVTHCVTIPYAHDPPPHLGSLECCPHGPPPRHPGGGGGECHGQPVTSQTYKGRVRVVGPTRRNRMLTVILAPTDDAGGYYPVTARPADRKERRNYEQQQ